MHIAICLPTRWLARNTKHLAEFNFGYYNMETMLDLMEAHFEAIADFGTLMVNEDYMMNMFLTIADKVDPFNNYLQFMFTEQLSEPVGVCKSVEDKVLLHDELYAELFYPTKANICQTERLVGHLAEEAVTTFLVEFRDLLKATSSHLSSIDGKYNESQISKEHRALGNTKM